MVLQWTNWIFIFDILPYLGKIISKKQDTILGPPGTHAEEVQIPIINHRVNIELLQF